MAPPVLEIALGLVNLGLLVALLILFFTQWRKMRSSFTGGLLLFALAFFIQDLLRLLAFASRASGVRVPLGRLDVLVELIQLVAVGTLIYVVTR